MNSVQAVQWLSGESVRESNEEKKCLKETEQKEKSITLVKEGQ